MTTTYLRMHLLTKLVAYTTEELKAIMQPIKMGAISAFWLVRLLDFGYLGN